MRVPRSTLLLLALTACEHTTPFVPGIYTPVGPLGTGNPVRLTYNPGVDERPSWLPSGNAFLYSQEQFGGPLSEDRDRCLAQMSGGGGTITREFCATTDPRHDSLNAFESPAVGGDGRMVYLQTSMLAFLGRVGADHSALVLATLANPLSGQVVQVVPFFGPSHRSVDVVSDVQWFGAGAVVFLSEQASYPAPCGSCTPDTVRAGIEIDLLDLSTDPPVLSLVPNTDQASSVAVVGGDTLYHTLNGSSTVLRRVGVAGTDTVIVDFGAAGPATDVTVAGGRVAAVVNGVLHLVTLATGTDSILSDLQTIVRHPAFAPGGKRLVAEVVPAANPKDSSDLWLWTLP